MSILSTIMKAIFHRRVEPTWENPAKAGTKTRVYSNQEEYVYDCPLHPNGPHRLHPAALKLYYKKYPEGDFEEIPEFTPEEKAYFDEHRTEIGGGLWGNEVDRLNRIKWQKEHNIKAMAFGPLMPMFHQGSEFHECPMCLLESHRKEISDHLIQKATAAHSGWFDYSKVGIIPPDKTKVTIICPEHGEHQVNFPKHANGGVSCRCNENLPDTVYLWKLTGAKYNARQVYKVGVTRGRLGTNRIKQVEKSSGYEAEVLAIKTINGNAYPIENKLLSIGQKVYHRKVFDGATELRAMTNAEVYQAVGIIEDAS